MKIQTTAIDDLVFDDKNARLHDDRNIDAIKDSLRSFGQQKPIVVDPNTMRVVAGNGTLRAAQEMGWKQLDVVHTDLDGLQAAAYAIADNRATDLSEWDDAQVLETMEMVRSEMGDDGISAAGFTNNELEDLLAGLKVDVEMPSDNESGFSRTEAEYEADTVKSFTFHFTLPQYEAIIRAFSELMSKYAVHAGSEVLVELLREAGHEVPDPIETED